MKREELIDLSLNSVFELVESLEDENAELRDKLSSIAQTASAITPEVATAPAPDREDQLVKEIKGFRTARKPREKISEEFKNALCQLRALGWSLPKIQKLSGVSQGVLSPMFRVAQGVVWTPPILMKNLNVSEADAQSAIGGVA